MARWACYLSGIGTCCLAWVCCRIYLFSFFLIPLLILRSPLVGPHCICSCLFWGWQAREWYTPMVGAWVWRQRLLQGKNDMLSHKKRCWLSQIANIAQVIYGPLIFITKLSILLLYIRVFAPSFKKLTFIFIQLLIWFNFLFYLADTLVKIFECTPRHKIWEKYVDGSCININIPILVTSAVNVVSDFLILLLPIVCVWRLQMKMSKKMGISAIFAAGSLWVCFLVSFWFIANSDISACVSSVVRLVVSIQNSNIADKTHDWFPEFLWTWVYLHESLGLRGLTSHSTRVEPQKSPLV